MSIWICESACNTTKVSSFLYLNVFKSAQNLVHLFIDTVPLFFLFFLYQIIFFGLNKTVFGEILTTSKLFFYGFYCFTGPLWDLLFKGFAVYFIFILWDIALIYDFVGLSKFIVIISKHCPSRVFLVSLGYVRILDCFTYGFAIKKVLFDETLHTPIFL